MRGEKINTASWYRANVDSAKVRRLERNELLARFLLSEQMILQRQFLPPKL